MSNLHGPLFVLALAAVALGMAAIALESPKALAKEGDCDPTRILVEGGSPSPFVLPESDGETLSVEPDAVLRVRVEDPPDDARLRWKGGRLFGDVGSATHEIGTTPIEIDVGSLSLYVRGLFEVEGDLLSDSREVCSTTFKLRIEGYAGATALVSAGATGVAGLVSIAGVPAIANATAAKANVNVRLRRRRTRGWRRWFPIWAWRRTIFGFFTGAIMGIGATTVMQQAGVNPLSLTTAIWGAVVGGGVVVGLGYSLGVIRTYMQSAEETDDER